MDTQGKSELEKSPQTPTEASKKFLTDWWKGFFVTFDIGMVAGDAFLAGFSFAKENTNGAIVMGTIAAITGLVAIHTATRRSRE